MLWKHILGSVRRPLVDEPGRVLLALTAAACVAGGLRSGLETPAVDFFHYWVVPQAVSERWTENVYSAAGGPEIARRSQEEAASVGHGARERDAARRSAALYDESLEVVGTPALYTAFALLNTDDYERDYRVFLAIRLAAYALGVFALARMLGYSTAAALAALAALTALFGPFQSDTRVGNVGQVQVAAIALFVWLQERQRWRGHGVAAGALLGLMVALKPNLAPVAVAILAVWLVSGRWRDALAAGSGAAAGAAIALVASSSFFGTWQSWSGWLATVPRLLATTHPVEEGNYALARMLLEWTGTDYSRPILLLLLAAVIVFAWRGRGRLARVAAAESSEPAGDGAFQQTVLAAGAGAAIGLLGMQLAWFHYFVLLVPLILWAFRPASEQPGPHPGALYRALAVIALALTTNLVYLAGAWGSAPPRAAYPLAALVLLGLALRDLRRNAPGPEPRRAPVR